MGRDVTCRYGTVNLTVRNPTSPGQREADLLHPTLLFQAFWVVEFLSPFSFAWALSTELASFPILDHA